MGAIRPLAAYPRCGHCIGLFRGGAMLAHPGVYRRWSRGVERRALGEARATVAPAAALAAAPLAVAGVTAAVALTSAGILTESFEKAEKVG